MSNSPSFHIAAAVGDIARVVLFPGDPLRAKALAERYLDEPKQFNDIRNMFGYTGLYRGRRISVMGSGMGIPSATLYAHELYTLYGVESILRIGTAGGVADDLALRSLFRAVRLPRHPRSGGGLGPAAQRSRGCGRRGDPRPRRQRVFHGRFL